MHQTIILCVGKKAKREMEVVDFLMIKGQQGFEAEKNRSNWNKKWRRPDTKYYRQT